MTDNELMRFVRYIFMREDGCWIWSGGKTLGGYGVFRCGSLLDGSRRNVSAHRHAYEHKKGLIPVGMQLDHLCRNRACVNPDHLEAVTGKENIARSPFIKKAFCPSGHEKVNSNGRLRCLVCDNLRSKARRTRDPMRMRAIEREQYRRRQLLKAQ